MKSATSRNKYISISGVGLTLCAALIACDRDPGPPVTGDLDITSRSAISGTVNGSAVAGKILATFNTGRGGSSSCDFESLPEGFNPGTFGTHT